MTESSTLPDDAPAQTRCPSTVSASPDYAFLVHSQQTLPHNLPPNVDNKSLARQKRRRTSPEDQAILEAEYNRNPKPDKNARQEIVRHVALGDKEVQIWFQNRRQNDRRKSRPLLPHELVPRSLTFDAPDPVALTKEYLRSNEDGNEGEQQSDAPNLANICSTQEEEGESMSSSQDTVGSSSHDASISSRASCETLPTASSSYNPQQTEVIDGQLPRTGYLANRRSASFARSNNGPITGEASQDNLSDVPLPRDRTLKKSSSLIRISLTSEGNAKVLTNDDSSPSPPRAAPSTAAANTTRAKLGRSHSAIELNEASHRTEVEPFKDIMPRVAAGRSRDSRAWEFWCDSDSRNALAEKANQDAGGSAADAIGLIRSNSRNVLGSNANKRNAQLLKRDAVKRLKSGTSGKTKLSRSASENGQMKVKESTDEPSVSTYSADVEIPNNESDKENWEPAQSSGQAINKATHHLKNETVMRQVLGESNNIPSKSSSFGAMMAQEKLRQARGMHDTENMDAQDDPEITKSKGASRKRSNDTNTSGEDLDCVQGLLSLSQGNWQ